MKKHKTRVDAFYEYLRARDWLSEMGLQYKKRFEKNRDKLFTFLSHDDVPWNNNNAEHAIRAFARLRDVVGGLVGEAAITEYLVLLSVCVTCKHKGVNVLEFFRSGSEDVDTYMRDRKRQCL